MPCKYTILTNALGATLYLIIVQQTKYGIIKSPLHDSIHQRSLHLHGRMCRNRKANSSATHRITCISTTACCAHAMCQTDDRMKLKCMLVADKVLKLPYARSLLQHKTADACQQPLAACMRTNKPIADA
eukprot:20910-Heterococcus_DN1.PRE.2